MVRYHSSLSKVHFTTRKHKVIEKIFGNAMKTMFHTNLIFFAKSYFFYVLDCFISILLKKLFIYFFIRK